jgi:hypothetical protein
MNNLKKSAVRDKIGVQFTLEQAMKKTTPLQRNVDLYGILLIRTFSVLQPAENDLLHDFAKL